MRGAASLHGRRGIRQISNAHEKLPKGSLSRRVRLRPAKRSRQRWAICNESEGTLLANSRQCRRGGGQSLKQTGPCLGQRNVGRASGCDRSAKVEFTNSVRKFSHSE